MALNECATAVFHLIAATMYYAYQNWGWSLTILLVALLLSRLKFIAGILTDVANFLGDLFLELELFSGGTLAIFGGVFITAVISLFVGLSLTIFVLSSRAHIVFKLVAAPFAFALGIIYGAIPGIFGIPFPIPLGIGMQISLDGTLAQWMGVDEALVANVVCGIPVLLIILSLVGFAFLPNVPIIGNFFENACGTFNWAIEILQGF